MSELTSTMKDDSAKAPVFSGALAYFPRALAAVSRVSEFGREKYNAEWGTKGFLLVDDGRRRYTDGLVRHLLAEETEGPINVADGGLHHDEQVAWNALARLEMRLVEEERKGVPMQQGVRQPNHPPMKDGVY